MFLKYALRKKLIPKKIFELPQSTASDFATLMPIFGPLERPNLFIFNTHNIHHNRRYWGLRRTIILQRYNRFAILFFETLCLFSEQIISRLLFVAYCTHPFFRNREIFLFSFTFHRSNHKFFPVLSTPPYCPFHFWQHGDFLDSFSPSNSGDNTPSASRHSGQKNRTISLRSKPIWCFLFRKSSTKSTES